MKLTYKRLKAKPSNLKSACGLTLQQFNFLVPAFEVAWNKRNSLYTFEGKPRLRARKARKNNTFESVEDMLIFILYDYRHNPTQDFMALHFDMLQPKVATWLKVLEPLLVSALESMKLIPQRTNEGLDERLLDSVTVLLDGSERPINRPKYEQQEYFSGKKNIIR